MVSCSVAPHVLYLCLQSRSLFHFPPSLAAKVRTQDFATPGSSLFHHEDLPPSRVDHFHFPLGRDAVTDTNENGEGLLGTASTGR